MQKETLIVGISEIKPFVFKYKGKLVGFEVDLWEEIAKNLNVKYEYQEMPFPQLINKVISGKLDLAFGAISQTVEREKVFDFVYPTMNSSLMIMLSAKAQVSFIQTLLNFVREKYKKIFSALVLLGVFIFGMSNLIWFIERGDGSFSTEYFSGLFDSIWWIVSTITTVGYGDFVPKSVLGKVVAILVMVLGIMFFGIYTAELASVITSAKKKYKIDDQNDLEGRRVATKRGTVAVAVLEKLNAKVVAVPKIEQAYNLLRQNRVDAVVFDAPILLDHAKNNPNQFIILESIFHPQAYSFACPSKNILLEEKINIELLKLQESGSYENIYRKWFGDKLI